jgi:hypothetical protein
LTTRKLINPDYLPYAGASRLTIKRPVGRRKIYAGLRSTKNSDKQHAGYCQSGPAR